MITSFKLFESTSMWNDFIEKINKGIIAKDKPDIKNIDKLIKLIPKNSNILDISIGDGSNTEYFIEKGFNVYGTDISDLAIKNMKEKYPQNTFIVHDTVKRFPFAENQFDLVFARLALHYFEKQDIKKILSDINRILNGYFFIMVKTTETGNVNTNKISYVVKEWIEIVSEKFNIIEYKEEFCKAYEFENIPSNLLTIIAKSTNNRF